MEQIITEKYYVKNLDCAACAAKLERVLNQTRGIKDASLDFANLMLHVTANDSNQVIEAVRRIEPSVELIPKTSKTDSADTHANAPEYRIKREAVFLGMALILFAFQFFIADGFQKNGVAWLKITLVMMAYLLAGWNVVFNAFRTIRYRNFLDENVLMVIATAGAMAIHAYAEAIGVMVFYKIGEMLQEIAVSRSRRSIKSLLAARPDKAVIKTPEGLVTVAPETVKPGDEIIVRPGEKIPLDGEVLAGESHLDTSSITGEFKPITVVPGDAVMAGQINKTGALTLRATKPFAESSIVKMMDLVENAAARKAKTEKFITSFARYYTPAVVLIAACIAFIPPVVTGASLQTWVYRALVILVISCPCALVVSIPLGYFGGIGRAARQGILVKGSNFIDALAGVKTIVFDKTGTLTKGTFKVRQVVCKNGYSKKQLTEFAAAAEYHSNHPIAASILEELEASGRILDASQIHQHNEITGVGVKAQYKNQTVIAGSDKFLHIENIAHDCCEFDTTVVHVAVEGRYAGYLMIGDEIKPDAKKAVTALRKEGIKQVVMLTGDNQSAASSIAHLLSLDQFHAGLLPEEKVTAFDGISRDHGEHGKIAFVGDGINDAPVIARSDVGVAMGALGSDAAIETADVVLMTDSPLKMAEAVSIAKHTRKIVWQNIAMAFLIKGIFISLGAVGLASMWEAVFADVGTALLAVANATRILGKPSIIKH